MSMSFPGKPDPMTAPIQLTNAAPDVPGDPADVLPNQGDTALPAPAVPAEAPVHVENQRIGIPEFLHTGIVFDDLTHLRADEIIAKYPESRSALLPLLHLVQSVQGCVTADGIGFCAHKLDLTVAEVEAVATFYTMYKRTPCGQHLVSVCTNALCAMLGGDAILAQLSGQLGIGPDETAGEPGTEGSITLEHAECLAACDHGPVLTVNYEYYDNQTPESAREIVSELQAGRKPHPTRGAPLTDFRTTEREIAGIYTDLSEQVKAPTASEQTLRGNEMADRLRQTAPAMPESYEMPPLPEKK